MTSVSDKAALIAIAKTIRSLSMDAIEAANSGHPGLPLGCAELGAYLFGKVLKLNPKDPKWINRDRFVLSAGHGSMLLYSCLYLAGFEVSLDHLKQFRQLGSPCAGHPEYGALPGIEATTGPLGQGLAMGVGIALGHKMAAQKFGADRLLDATVYVLSGDGCMMEGIVSEAASFSGHLGLDNLVVIYDANDICLDGPIEECFSDDTALKFKAVGWNVHQIDGHDFDQIAAVFEKTAQRNGKPSLIIAKTTIGKGAPTVQGTCEVHGKAMGADEVLKTKTYHEIPHDPFFYVDPVATAYFKTRQTEWQVMQDNWSAAFSSWAAGSEDKKNLWDQSITHRLPANLDEILAQIAIKQGVATRQSAHSILQTLGKEVPFLMGGSADLSCSDSTLIKDIGIVAPHHFAGRNIKFGVREFAMGAICNGLYLHGMWRPFCGTFLTFSDYMRNAIRLAAIMKLPVIYQFTHDSILLGEDGPTHQPVEHLASLRAMPGLTVIRPADANETRGAWLWALKHSGPTALILTRQGCPDIAQSGMAEVARGAYIIKSESREGVDYCILATGSEVSLAKEVATILETKGHSVRVVSMPSFEIFDAQPADYRETVLGGNIRQYWSIEAQTSFGWHKYIGRDGHTISVDEFGVSAPASALKVKYGFSPEAVVEKMERNSLCPY